MPIIECKNGYIFRSEVKPKKKKSVVLKIIFLLLIFAGAVFLATNFSSSITSLLGINTSNYFNKKNLYAIKIASLDSYDDAFVLSNTIKKQGGAGYILNQNGCYDVLLSCYQSKTDAQKVIDNLNSQGVDCECYTITLKAISIDFEVNKEQKNIIKKCVNSFFDNYASLYDLSVCYDDKTFSKKDVLTELDRIIEKNNENIKKFGNIKTEQTASLVYLKIYLGEMLEKLNNLKLCDENFNAEIKATYFECLNLYINFRNEVQK